MSTFRWLHISDLHVGVGSQASLWPRFKARFLDDLSRMVDETGTWNAVLFSGDLTQQATREEFDRLDAILDDIWARLEALGCNPPLVTVPGNHDLSWPSELNALQLQPYWSSPVLRDALMNGSAEAQFEVISKAFTEYTQWRERSVHSGRHAIPAQIGVMPGDASYRIAGSGGHAGVVALNSAWLHLGKGNHQGKLAVDVQQILGVTDQDPDRWLAENAYNFLMTHHPVNWLHPESQNLWRSDINSPDRFDFHLFGHMHEQDFTATAHGGGAELRTAQGSALFGLEYLGDGKTERIQGYSLNALEDRQHSREVKVWPRILTPQRDGSQEITADTSLGLKDGRSFTRHYDRPRSAGASSGTAIVSEPVVVSLSRPSADISAELESIRYHIEDETAHRNVRRLELHQAVTALEQERVAWVAADWGMGEDGFLAAIQAHFGEIGADTYRLDLSGYERRQQFLDEAHARFGTSFEALCENISTVGPAYILLNDIPVDHSGEAGALSFVRDIEALAELIAEFAPSAKVLLRTQRAPRSGARVSVVELKALDEADVAIYLRDSGPMGASVKQPQKISQIFRFTDGVPSRIDNALRELEVTSLDELVSANSDLSATALTVAVPQALAGAVAELAASQDKAEERAFELLKVLTALPQGEQLPNIARLDGPIPFRPPHALELTGRALLDTSPLIGLGAHENTTSKALIVPRPVREYVRSCIDPDESSRIDGKLLRHFFGNNWRSGEISSSHAGKRASNSLCSTQEIVNASTLIVRSLRRAVENDEPHDIDASISLASAFVECLDDGSHYRGAIALCDDVLMLLPGEDRKRQVTILKYERARALRMCGMLDEVCDILHSINYSLLSKGQKQGAKLNLALALQSQGKSDEAAKVARDCIAIDKRASAALQAHTIIARQIQDRDEREAELRSLLDKSNRKKSNVNANNITLMLADEALDRGDVDVARELFREVINRARREGDFYNGARAIAELASRHPPDMPFPVQDKLRLIDAYHFSYNERRTVLFDQCHDALWNIFEAEGDTENLLSLFRHSSFIWRINGREIRESKYIERLRGLRSRMLQATRDRDYFFVRIIIVLGPGETLQSRSNQTKLRAG